jgi:thioesterase domain-containing protein
MLNVALDPGVAARLKGPNATERLAREMASALCEKQPQGPYYLGGFCCDGVFAYEIARQLIMYGHEVGLLALVEPFTPVQGVASRIMMAAKRILFRTGFRLRELSRLGIGQFPQYARSRWNGLRTMAKEASWRKSARARVRKRQANSLDMDEIVFVASSSYKPKPLGCPTVIFHCKDWPMLSAGDPYFGWRKFLTGRSATVEVPGDHIGIFRDPSVGVLAEKLKACLANTNQMEKPESDMILEGDRKLYLDQSRA